MKKVLVMMLAVVALLTACNGDKKPKVLKDGAFVYVNIKNDGMRVIEDNTIPTVEGDQFKRLTPKEVVEKALMFYFYAPDMGRETNIGVGDEQRDIANARIKMWGEMIISEDGSLNEGFLDWRDVRILIPIVEGDVGAYIPNAVMKEASEGIRKAYKAGDYDEVYRLFKEAFTAIPITKAEWEALKAEGKQ
ncbi:hypothetical protein QYZ87_03620 [Porphyromonadaceae bacterium W3.11]|nr:hypothetical protein [Porphyromonadaceae bacterium W3.11]